MLQNDMYDLVMKKGRYLRQALYTASNGALKPAVVSVHAPLLPWRRPVFAFPAARARPPGVPSPPLLPTLTEYPATAGGGAL